MRDDGTANLGMTREVTRKEVERAVKKIKNSKAVGPDNIPVAEWRSLGGPGMEKLTELMRMI